MLNTVLLRFFYIDDRAMPYTTRTDMIRGTKISIDIFSKFGLTVHVGTKEKKSKTESVFFPSTITLKKWRESILNNRITNSSDNSSIITLKDNNQQTHKDYMP